MTPSQHSHTRPETTPERFAADLAAARGALAPWVAGRLAALADDPSLTDAERGARLRAYVAAWDAETTRRRAEGGNAPRWSSQAGLASFAPTRSTLPPAGLPR